MTLQCNLSLNINLKYFFFVVLCYYQAWCQTDIKNDSVNRNDFEFHIDPSFTIPLPVGDNFAKSGLQFNYGLSLNFNFHLKNNIFFSFGFQHLKADVINKNLLGFYDDTQVNTFFITGGYRFYLNTRLRFEPYIGLGLTTYNNKRADQTLSIINFRDTAGTLIISPSLKYQLSKKFMVFLKPEYRMDQMNIRVDPEIDNLFNRASYLNLLIGASLTFY